MTPQEHSELKWLINQKQWKTYLKFLEDEIQNKMRLIETMQTKEEVWDMRNKVLGIKEAVFIVEQRIDDFEVQSKEKK